MTQLEIRLEVIDGEGLVTQRASLVSGDPEITHRFYQSSMAFLSKEWPYLVTTGSCMIATMSSDDLLYVMGHVKPSNSQSLLSGGSGSGSEYKLSESFSS